MPTKQSIRIKHQAEKSQPRQKPATPATNATQGAATFKHLRGFSRTELLGKANSGFKCETFGYVFEYVWGSGFRASKLRTFFCSWAWRFKAFVGLSFGYFGGARERGGFGWKGMLPHSLCMQKTQHLQAKIRVNSCRVPDRTDYGTVGAIRRIAATWSFASNPKPETTNPKP